MHRKPPATDNKPRNVLWTSGWDSTFRVVELLLAGQTVQPWYVFSDKTPRPSNNTELKAMRNIRMKLQQEHPETERLLLPLKVIKESSIAPRPDLRETIQRLRHRKGTMADQYVFLSALLDRLDLTMEVGIHKGGSVIDSLGDNLEIRETPTEPIMIVREGADEDVQRLFGRMTFPLFNISKPEMGEVSRDSGFDDVMEMTWFCASPVFGKPCGHCAPCRTTREYGMTSRVPSGRKGLRYLGYKAIWWRTKNPNGVLLNKLKSSGYRALVRLREMKNKNSL